jgi:hypothetical protein
MLGVGGQLGAAVPLGGFPYIQGFDSVSPPALPPGWASTQHRSPGQNDFVTSVSSPRSLPNALLSTNATIEQSLISPLFDFDGLGPDRLSFYTRRSSTHRAQLVVEASLDSGRSYTAVLGDTRDNTGQSAYVLASFVLPDSLNRSRGVRFRWRVSSDSSGAAGTLRIDDISITVKSTVDLALVGMRVSPVLPTEGDSVTVSATVKNVGLRGQQGFAVDFFVDSDRDSIPQLTERVGSLASTVSLEAGDSVEIATRIGALPAGEQLLMGELLYTPDQNPSNNQFHVQITVGYSPGRFVINEIQYAPSGGEPEWIELYNAKTTALNLKNWSLSDINTTVKRTLTASNLFVVSNGYVVLTKDSAGLMDVRRIDSSPVITLPGFPTLNNSGDAVVLFDRSGATADSVEYQPSWGGVFGNSLERVDPLGVSTDSTNWATSQDLSGSTPGRQNSVAALSFDLRVLHTAWVLDMAGSILEIRVNIQNIGIQHSEPFRVLLYDDRNRDSLGAAEELCHSVSVHQPLSYRESLAVVVLWNRPPPGVHQVIVVVDDPRDLRPSNNRSINSVVVPFPERTVVVNELMFAPVPGNSEYVELMNVSQDTVDLADWKLSDLPTSSGGPNNTIVTREHCVVQPGELVVVASDSTIFSLFSYLRESGIAVFVVLGNLNLNNDRDAIVLKDASGRVIDSVAYSPSWHNPGVVDPMGRSLEKIRPLGSSNDSRNWSTCAHPVGGTPGRQNSIYTSSVAVSARLAITPNPFSPDGDGREDFSLIQYEVPLQVSMVSVRIFDVKGRLIRWLANNEPSGAKGSVFWDGRDDERRKARIGLYIVLLEALDDRGGVLETAKGVVVLAARL